MTLSPTPRLFLKRTTIKAHGLKMKSCLFSLQQWFSFFQMSSDYKLGFLLLLSTFVFCHLFPKKNVENVFKKNYSCVSRLGGKTLLLILKRHFFSTTRKTLLLYHKILWSQFTESWFFCRHLILQIILAKYNNINNFRNWSI